MAAERPRIPLAPALIGLGSLVVLLVIASVAWGRTGRLGMTEATRGILAALGLVEDDGLAAAKASLRLWQALTTAGVGAAMALAGALLQGIFRNGLAAPSIIGVTGGASLGAAGAVLVLGGYAPTFVSSGAQGHAHLAVAAASFIGALGVTALIVSLATRAGRISVPTLLLAGIAVNACCGGLLALIQAITQQDYEIARAIFLWTFGSLEDKAPVHAASIGGALLAALLAIPFLATELDLFAGGEDDARGLGVRPERTKALAIIVATLLAAVSVAVAGQIVFVGLVVPHLARILFGRSHRRLLPLVLLSGAVFLLGAEWAQTALLGDRSLRPGVLMSLIGGPFFLSLLVSRRGELRGW
ncbi:MAG: iron ABC transporter permease [Planctomycetota bacterium]